MPRLQLIVQLKDQCNITNKKELIEVTDLILVSLSGNFWEQFKCWKWHRDTDSLKWLIKITFVPLQVNITCEASCEKLT